MTSKAVIVSTIAESPGAGAELPVRFFEEGRPRQHHHSAFAPKREDFASVFTVTVAVMG